MKGVLQPQMICLARLLTRRFGKPPHRGLAPQADDRDAAGMPSRRALLQSAANELAHDYASLDGGAWACHFTDDFQLQVTQRGTVVGSVSIRREFDPENWPAEALESVFIESTEQDDAIESVAEAGEEASWQHGTPWFYCPSHVDQPLMVCGSAWTCSKGHDVRHVGVLGEA